MEFKIITKSQLGFTRERQGATAITPVGAESNRISIDISEKEYCGSFDKVRVESVEVRVYSRVLLVLEKLRAICQSHPDYKFRNKKSNRARDFYDIEQIYSKVLNDEKLEEFFGECAKHIESVFDAKEVPLNLIERCLSEKEFLDAQQIGWEEVKTTVKNLDQQFSYYHQTLKDIISELRKQGTKI